MKHRISFYLTYACIVLFGSIGLLLLALGEKSPRESASENRMLAGFPALSAEAVRDGSFMDGLESYLSDGMPARERIVTDTAVLLNAIALSKEDGAEENVFDEIGAPAQMPEETELPQADTILLEPDAPQTPEPTDCPPAGAVPSPSGSPENTEPMQTAIPVAACSLRRIRPDGTSRMTETYSETSIQNAIDVLNAYRSVLPEDGRLFFTQSPYASVALTMQHGEFTGWESDVEAMLQSNTLSGVEIVSTIDVLEEPLLAGEDLFFRTDHHWTPRGACYLAQAMLKRMGIDAPDYDAYSYKTYRSFYGSTVTAHPERKSTTTPDTIDVLIPNLPVKGCTIAWDGSEKPCPFILENNDIPRVSRRHLRTVAAFRNRCGYRTPVPGDRGLVHDVLHPLSGAVLRGDPQHQLPSRQLQRRARRVGRGGLHQRTRHQRYLYRCVHGRRHQFPLYAGMDAQVFIRRRTS